MRAAKLLSFFTLTAFLLLSLPTLTNAAGYKEIDVANGGTITHHHAVGKMHRPWYDQQMPDLYLESLKAMKRTLDPAGILNPGVLVDP